MSTSILVAVDGSPASRRAAQLGLELAAGLGGPITFLTVVKHGKLEEIDSGGDHWTVSNVDRAEEQLRDFVKELEPSVEYGIVALSGQPVKMITAEANRLEADILIVGNKRLQSMARVLGSVAGDLLRHPPCNILVAE